MTDREIELQKIENLRRMKKYSLIFRGCLGVGVFAAWVYSIATGILATAIMVGFLDTKGSGKTTDDLIRDSYIQLGYLDRLDNE